MSLPTPTTYTEWNGSSGFCHWRATFANPDIDDFSDGVVIDISALTPAPNSVKVTRVTHKLNGDFSSTLEFDATTDQLIYEISGQTNSSLVDVTNFAVGPSGGRSPDPAAAGFVGDILLSTSGVADGDELTLDIEFEKKT